RDHWQIANPRVRLLDVPASDEAMAVVPVYPLTENLRPEHLRRIVRAAIQQYGDLLPDILPADLRARHQLPSSTEALRNVHFPTSLRSAQAGRRRFVYESFLLLQLALALRRRDLRDRQQAPPLPATSVFAAHIRPLFPLR